jgi:hypothetical protein
MNKYMQISGRKSGRQEQEEVVVPPSSCPSKGEMMDMVIQLP